MAWYDVLLPKASTTPIDFTNITPYMLGRNFLLPFILVYVILLAILEKLNVFDKKVNIVLSLGMCILFATTPGFAILSTYIAQIGGGSVIVIFGIVLVFGVAVWGFGRGKDIYYEQMAPEKKIAELNKKIRKARSKKPPDFDTAEALERQKKQWEHIMQEKNR